MKNIKFIFLIVFIFNSCDDKLNNLAEKSQRNIKAELKAKHEAELKAKHEAELKAKHEAELKAKHEAELKVKHEAELKAKHEAELKAKHEAELKAKLIKKYLKIKPRKFTFNKLTEIILGNFKSKGEFEKTSDFIKRRDKHYKKVVKENGLMAFEGKLDYEYNADTEEIQIKLSKLINYNLEEPKISKYIAKNGFGQEFEVMLVESRTMKLKNDLLLEDQYIKLNMKPKKASILKKHGKMKIVFSFEIKDKVIALPEEFDFGGDNINSLIRFKGMDLNVFVDVKAILIYNEKTSEIIYSLIPEVDTWKSVSISIEKKYNNLSISW
jgi:hypothetical protein